MGQYSERFFLLEALYLTLMLAGEEPRSRRSVHTLHMDPIHLDLSKEFYFSNGFVITGFRFCGQRVPKMLKQRRNSADNRAGKLKELIISFLNLQYKRVGIFIHFSVFHYAILNMHYLSHNCTFKIVICILKISTYHYISTT